MNKPETTGKIFWRHHLIAVVVILVSCLILYPLSKHVGYLAIALLLLFIVTMLSLWLERGPVFLAATSSALLWNFLFIPPLFTFTIARLEDLLIFIMYFIIAMVTGSLTSRIRGKEKALRQREERALALYAMSYALANADSVDAIAQIVIEQIDKSLNADVALLTYKDKSLRLHPASKWLPDEKTIQSICNSLENKGIDSSTPLSPGADVKYRPLITPRNLYGVIGVRLRGEKTLRPDHESLLENFISQISAAMERESLHEQRRQVELAASSERFYKTLLNSISHELRTPLAVISGAAGSLIDRNLSLPETSRSALIHEIFEASNRLNSLVGNLLDMSRLESGKIQPKREWCDIEDLFGGLKSRYEPLLTEHTVIMRIPPRFPLVYIDSGLLEQSVGNLVVNAARYTPRNTAIEVNASLIESDLLITVKDQGPGFPIEAIPHLFNKFYRIPGTATGGTGLGLSISKGFVECMQGTISAENHQEGGAILTIRLPVSVKPFELEAIDE